MEPDMTVPVDEAPAKIVGGEKAEVSPARAALVQSWLEKIKEARAHLKIKKAFERMKMCQRIAATGSQEVAWVEGGSYVLPVINRHINLATSQLYAKHPTIVTKRKMTTKVAMKTTKMVTTTNMTKFALKERIADE